MAGLATVPALVRETDDRDSLLLALVENVAREDLSPVDEARAYAVLMDEFGLALGEVAEQVGRSKPTVSNRVRLLELPDDVLGLVERGQLSEGHARAVLAVPDNEERRRLARRIVRQGHVRARRRAGRALGRRADEAAAAAAGRPGPGRAGPGCPAAARRAPTPKVARRPGRALLRRARSSWRRSSRRSSAPRYNLPARAISSVG